DSLTTPRLPIWKLYLTCIPLSMSLHKRIRTLRVCFINGVRDPRHLHSFPTRRSSDLGSSPSSRSPNRSLLARRRRSWRDWSSPRSEEHTSELQSRVKLVCRLLLEKKKIRDSLTSTRLNKSTQSFTLHPIPISLTKRVR